MTFSNSTDEGKHSASSDIPAELSKSIIDPVELDDIDENDLVFIHSPPYSNDSSTMEITSDSNTNCSADMETIPKTKSNMSILEKLEVLERLTLDLEAKCAAQTKQTLEVEQSIMLSKAKENEKVVEQHHTAHSHSHELHTQKLLQYMTICLETPAMSNIIKYINQSKTEFQIKDMERFVKLWGKQKGKGNMTIRKVYRSISYLINQKKQLKKIGKYKYRILNNDVDVTISPNPSSPWQSSDAFSPSNSELSLESTNLNVLTQIREEESTTSSPIFVMQNSEYNNLTPISLDNAVTDWLMKNKSPPAYILNGIKGTAGDVGAVASTPLLAISQQPPISSLQTTQQSTTLAFTRNSCTPQSAINQQPFKPHVTITGQSSTSKSFISENNSIKSTPTTNLHSLVNFETLTINSTTSHDSNIPDINEMNCYTYCINPSELTSNCVDSQQQLNVSTTPRINKTPRETIDYSSEFSTDIDTPIHFNAERMSLSNVGLSTHFHTESPTPADNLTEMALTGVNFNSNLEYSTVNNIINSEEFNSTFPEFNDLTLFARALSNEPINFDIFNDDFRENTLLDQDLFINME